MKVSLYAGEQYQKLNTFDDEKIFFEQKLNDIEKLSNVFSDSSISFTVPADQNNNAVLKHYYDIYVDNGYNANIRIPAYVEVDTFPYKFGEFQIEGVVMKEYQPASYKLTFYDLTSQLSKLFGKDSIKELDYDGTEKNRSILSDFDYAFTSANFVNSINNPSFKGGDMITPLINSSNKDWNYGGGTSDNVADISIDSGAITHLDLRSSLRLKVLFEAIEAKYGVTFSKDFLNKATFRDLFIWLNGRDNDSFSQGFDISIYQPFVGTDTTSALTQVGDVTYIEGRKYNESIYVTYFINMNYIITPTITSLPYTAIILDEDDNEISVQSNVTGSINIGRGYASILYPPDTTTLVTKSFKLKIVTQVANTFTVNAKPSYRRNVLPTSPPSDGVGVIYLDKTSSSNVNNATVNFEVNNNLPDLQVVDLVTNVMKMFKLIIRPTGINSFYLDTIDGYYSKGKIVDITQFVDQKTVPIERPSIYNKIEFKYNKTDNVTGKKFRQLFSPIQEIGYGDLAIDYPLVKSGDELKVELKFDNMMFEKITSFSGENTNICIGQAITTSDDVTFSPNSSTIVLFYNNGINALHTEYPFKVKFGNDAVGSISYSYIIGNTNNEYFNQVTDSLNWGEEFDPWLEEKVQLSLYSNYWKNWIETIYDLKQRKFKYEATLPARYVEEISLNDRLIIRDTRYKINDFKIDITTGESTLNLFVDIYSIAPPITESSITPSVIATNAGVKHFDVFLTTNQSWSISYIDTGDGNDWVSSITDESGVNSKLLTFRVEEKCSQSPPEVYEPRSMIVRITLEDTTELDITFNQFGLVEP